MNYLSNSSKRLVRQRGFSLMEVLIGIVIFAIGMLALASLQGALTRSTAEAKVRTEAINLAEETIEDFRGFTQLDAATGVNAYADIVTGTATESRNGVSYTVTRAVSDYYYDLTNDTFTQTAPSGAIHSNYKTVVITVTWGAAAEFVVDANNTLAASDLGGNAVTVTATISTVSVAAAAQVVDQSETTVVAPPVDYTPGQRPDVVSLALGNSKFKESTLPEPDVIRLNELVETRFDVVTYSTTNGAVFLRREEFISVGCECEMKAAPGDASNAGRRPAIWAGDEYTEAQFIDKPYGVSANNIQSAFCDTCCQDHHDGGTGSNDPASDPGAIRIDPFRTATTHYWGTGTTFEGDHKHYKKDRFGNLSEATAVDDVYVESCKLVRKDGFMRVAQDMRQEGLNVFPYDYPNDDAEITGYSNYATGEISTYLGALTDGYESAPPAFTPPSRTDSDTVPPPSTDLTLDHTYLPTALSAEFQQLRSRGIYLDYLSEDLRAVMTCLSGGGNASTCTSGDVVLDQTESVNILEMTPFFDVQLTFLNRWTEIQPNDPVDTTNEALQTNNGHSRGVANKVTSVGASFVHGSGHRGNSGLTDIDPIDPFIAPATTDAQIKVIVNNDNPPPPNGTIVTGVITSGVAGVQASNVEISYIGAICDRTVQGFVCLVPNGTGSTITLSNYHRQNNSNIVACSTEPTLPGTNSSDNANNPITTFNIDGALDTIIYQVTIEDLSCNAGA